MNPEHGEDRIPAGYTNVVPAAALHAAEQRAEAAERGVERLKSFTDDELLGLETGLHFVKVLDHVPQLTEDAQAAKRGCHSLKPEVAAEINRRIAAGTRFPPRAWEQERRLADSEPA